MYKTSAVVFSPAGLGPWGSKPDAEFGGYPYEIQAIPHAVVLAGGISRLGGFFRKGAMDRIPVGRFTRTAESLQSRKGLWAPGAP